MDAGFTELYKAVLRDCFSVLSKTIDTLVIRGQLYERRAITAEQMTDIDKERVKTRSAENLILYFINERPSEIHTFIKILEENGYDFLVESLHKKARERQNRDKKETVHRQRKSDIFTDHRKDAVCYRHNLKRLSQSGDMKNFLSEQQKWLETWKTVKLTDDEYTKCADMCFMALDAELEHRRVVRDKTLYKDDIFNRVREVIPGTSNPPLSSMMCLARHGSALVVAGCPLETGIDRVEKAMDYFALLPSCRETGIVLYIYFNMLSLQYEASPSTEQKNELLNVARDAIYHFQREDEQMGLDFKRMMLIKIAYLHLDIGISCNQLTNVEGTKENYKTGYDCLKTVRNTPDMWQRMEPRWKMFYWFAEAKVEEEYLKRNTQRVRKCMENAISNMNKGKFSKEEELNLRNAYVKFCDTNHSNATGPKSSIVGIYCLTFIFILFCIAFYVFWVNKVAQL